MTKGCRDTYKGVLPGIDAQYRDESLQRQEAGGVSADRRWALKTG